MDSEKKVLFPEDLQEATGLGLQLIYRQLRSNKIPHVKVGDRYLISRSNFEKWINGESNQAKTGASV